MKKINIFLLGILLPFLPVSAQTGRQDFASFLKNNRGEIRRAFRSDNKIIIYENTWLAGVRDSNGRSLKNIYIFSSWGPTNANSTELWFAFKPNRYYPRPAHRAAFKGLAIVYYVPRGDSVFHLFYANEFYPGNFFVECEDIGKLPAGSSYFQFGFEPNRYFVIAKEEEEQEMIEKVKGFIAAVKNSKAISFR